MCGIAGWVGNNKKSGALTDKVRIINKILDDQAYRGPDARGIWTDDSNKAVFVNLVPVVLTWHQLECMF